jgi:methyltransferase
MTAVLTVAAIVFLPMALEAARSARNERVQLSRGGVEAEGDVFGLMRVVYPLSFLAMIGEGAWRNGAPPALVICGAAIFGLAKALKWWAIRTLGDCWTFRVIVVPQTVLVDAGPYRWLRHPNYLGVVGELVGVAMMTGALVTGPVATVVFLILLAKRIRVEERTISSILG